MTGFLHLPSGLSSTAGPFFRRTNSFCWHFRHLLGTGPPQLKRGERDMMSVRETSEGHATE